LTITQFIHDFVCLVWCGYNSKVSTKKDRFSFNKQKVSNSKSINRETPSKKTFTQGQTKTFNHNIFFKVNKYKQDYAKKKK